MALKRRNLTLWRAPRATLRHFRQNTTAASVSGAKWTAQHPLTLFIALPILLLYIGWKWSGVRCPVREALHSSADCEFCC